MRRAALFVLVVACLLAGCRSAPSKAPRPSTDAHVLTAQQWLDKFCAPAKPDMVPACVQVMREYGLNPR